ncbi:hypothetical protein [Nonomuraea dietziae]|uniref:hypothetical protein n=1 Tax=Nonomuraea dietziae TaxID=65515 RepID=UPI0033FC5A9C
MSTAKSTNGSAPAEETGRKNGTAYLHDKQLYHAAAMFDAASHEVTRLADEIQREASNYLYDRGPINEKAIHDTLTEAQQCMLIALHFATQLHEITCPEHREVNGSAPLPTGFNIDGFTDEPPF